MEYRRIEDIKPMIEDKTASQIIFGCSNKYGRSVIFDLDFAKIILKLANIQKNFEKLVFNVITNISCPLKALDMFT